MPRRVEALIQFTPEGLNHHLAAADAPITDPGRAHGIGAQAINSSRNQFGKGHAGGGGLHFCGGHAGRRGKQFPIIGSCAIDRSHGGIQ
jgi:hypothetical protein